MTSIHLLLTLWMLTVAGYFIGRSKAFSVCAAQGGPSALHSRPFYYGILTSIWCAVPALIVFSFWHFFQSTIIMDMVMADLPDQIRSLPDARLNLVVNDIKNIVSGNTVSVQISPAIQAAADHYKSLEMTAHTALGVIITAITMVAIAGICLKITPTLRARNHVEKIVEVLLIACAVLAVFTTIGIVLSVLYESIRFFKIVPVHKFLFGFEWSPQMAIHAEQIGSSGAFGVVPIIFGTMLIAGIAMCVAVPLGIMSAIYLSEYANGKFRRIVKPLLGILGSIPTVVYGFFAALVVAPAIKEAGDILGFSVSSASALAAGVVTGIMLIPFVGSLSDDAINAVPQSLRDGALSLGSTRSETIIHVVLPAALPGIVGGVLLAVSRAIGETMIVVMAAGLSAHLTANPFEAVTTVTVQIVSLLVGEQEFDSAKTLAAFALGLVLFVATLILNVVALTVVRKYRAHYA
ncbi:phosphate ABC transporter permease subunit PstC [Desulfobacter hydrogenophilus]|uniref:Phosphate transport system permease protein n=1 Tax=Desulfobacter hydrogenophilus TaxID=2291 RepID=A0A328FBW1_9BACT|nr:phosphate ABC transporter permease subunit PstC [Desulfobacter hydrogenophilus]NDY73667.1 phosphate ABC transporter permease subunit PstC [Desulfobacter hydrogenophilus]QBH14943.1 phosphate ABC transporter permease subunit PstC [Desulfobacter hydrogenophilus]RAM00603.1 phosphate ABC transporter permease subunit PstC [Desulfobacter hydrogenophilus]